MSQFPRRIFSVRFKVKSTKSFNPPLYKTKGSTSEEVGKKSKYLVNLLDYKSYWFSKLLQLNLISFHHSLYCSTRCTRTQGRRHTERILSTQSHPDKQQRRERTRRRHIKARVGQAVGLKQDVPLFLACMWNSVSSRAGPWLLSPANGERVQADKAEGICSTFHRPFKQHSGSQTARLWVRWRRVSSWAALWSPSAAVISCGLV